jgi:hypothetical protein
MFVVLKSVDTLNDFELAKTEGGCDIVFNTTIYIIDIYKSFDTKHENVLHQVNLDFPRLRIILNYDEATMETLLEMHPVIVMLSTQASFFTMVYTIHILYSNYERGLLVVDLHKQGTNNSYIEITSHGVDWVTMTFFRVFGLMHIPTETLTHKISVTLSVDLLCLTGSDVYDVANKTDNKGIISWQVQQL